MNHRPKRGREREARQRVATIAQVTHILKALIAARIAGVAREMGIELPPTIASYAASETATKLAAGPPISSRHFLQDMKAALDALVTLKKLESDRPKAGRKPDAELVSSLRAKLDRLLNAN